MDFNNIGDVIRYKLLTNLGKDEIDSTELDALIEEIGQIVVTINKIFVSEIVELKGQIEELTEIVDSLDSQIEDLIYNGTTGTVNNINIHLDKNIGDLFR